MTGFVKTRLGSRAVFHGIMVGRIVAFVLLVRARVF
ncbi:UNVERIFIED_ORG: hypothetical protein M2414_002126 [Rahnella aquatilis]|nr:hypothetical protein [Rahnella aquatilis]RKT80617.1 hypothetical protein BJ925_0863 [Rahnella aquatilis]